MNEINNLNILLLEDNMGVVDLSNRLTSDWDKYCTFLKSSSSYVFTENIEKLDKEDLGSTTINLLAGDKYWNPNSPKEKLISQKGLNIKPKESIVLVVKNKIGLPLNVFGSIYGRGTNIFNGFFVSSGKIDPGFQGYLKIGLYNGNNKKITIKTGEIIASCSFYNMDLTLNNVPIKHTDLQYPTFEDSKFKLFLDWILTNAFQLLGFITSIIAIIIAATN